MRADAFVIARLRALSELDRIALAAACVLTVMGAAAMGLWWRTGFVQWVWNGVLPPSLWAIVAVGLVHWRQMRAHGVTQLAQLSGHAEVKAAHRDAASARRIMADLYKHQTGLHHPDAPREGT